VSDTTDDLRGSAWGDDPNRNRAAENWERDVRARLRTDMASTLRQHMIEGFIDSHTSDVLLDALVEDAMHQVHKAAEEGRP
jgi:hypothetical protein